MNLYQVLTFDRYNGERSELKLIEATSPGAALAKAMDIPDEDRAAFEAETVAAETPFNFLPVGWKQWVLDNEETSYIITLPPARATL